MICIVCQRREAERAQACQPCRTWLPTVLRDIQASHAALDPAATSSATGPRVSGSREAPVPVNLDALDLAAAARLGSRGPHTRGVLGDADQVGRLSVATELEFWVIDWIGARDRAEHRPAPTVATLAGWLDVRIEWACDEHPAVDEFAADMRSLRTALRRVTGELPQRPEPLIGVACSGCDQNALFRDLASQWRAECGACGKLYSDDEYSRWTGLLASWQRVGP